MKNLVSTRSTQAARKRMKGNLRSGIILLLIMVSATPLMADQQFTLPPFKEGALNTCPQSGNFSTEEVLIDAGFRCMEAHFDRHERRDFNPLEMAKRYFITVQRKTAKLLHKSVAEFFTGITFCRELQTLCNQNDITGSCFDGPRLVKKKFCFARKRARESFLAVNFDSLNFKSELPDEASKILAFMDEFDQCTAGALNQQWDESCYDDTIMTIVQLREKANGLVESRIDELFTNIDSPYYAIMASKKTLVGNFEDKIQTDYEALSLKRNKVVSDYHVYNDSYLALKEVVNSVFQTYIGMLEDVAAIHSQVKDLADLLIDPDLAVKLAEKNDDLGLLKNKVETEARSLENLVDIDVNPGLSTEAINRMAFRFCATYYCEAKKPIRPNQPKRTWLKKSCFIMKNKHHIDNPLCKGKFSIGESLVNIDAFCATVRTNIGDTLITEVPVCSSYSQPNRFFAPEPFQVTAGNDSRRK